MAFQISLSGEKRIVPKGFLVAVGGNEDKENDLSILKSITSLVNKDVVKIEVITTASDSPEEVGDKYMSAFKKLGGNTSGLIHINTREQAEDADYLKRVGEADIVFFSGGDQLRITSILGGSSILNEIKRRYREELFAVAGTSAGAMALPEIMIYGGNSQEALLKGFVDVTGGLGLINGIIIDSHFINRGRFSRLMQVIAMNPGYIGLGLGENTGVIIEDGRILKAIGYGLVVIFDGQNILYSNVADIKDKEAIAIEEMHIHTIVKGHGDDILKRAYLKQADILAISPSTAGEGGI